MGLKHAVLTGFFMFLLLTGGYPAFAIILFYFFIIILLWFSIKRYKDSKWKGVFQLLKLNAIATGTAILLSMVVLVSLYFVLIRWDREPLRKGFNMCIHAPSGKSLCVDCKRGI